MHLASRNPPLEVRPSNNKDLVGIWDPLCLLGSHHNFHQSYRMNHSMPFTNPHTYLYIRPHSSVRHLVGHRYTA